MADRSVKVTLRADTADFRKQIASAGSTLEDLAKKGDKTGQVSQTFMGRMVQSAQLQREAWTTAGTALTGFGAAVTGIGVAALSTGISYNQLQQTSRAALTTLTGSAEEANAQMDKLDAFASTSPFAKDVFITAQQQMLGFGIEAQKVIPYLDAIQNAVAATGGSNQDISELSRIFSQISASAKITGEDLREFGNRGIDAATIIGSQMGMTGAQIREQITAGTLDAGTALDALASGMQDRFGGAADNVKNTLSGAFDRVKAAWRDLSSELAAPLVGTEGGGLLTGLLNLTADLMRAFQDLPGPVKNTVAALSGVAGVGALAGGAFLLLTPRILDTMTAISQLKPRWQDFQDTMPRLSGAIGKVGTALKTFGIIAGGVTLTRLGMELTDAIRGVDRAVPGVETLTSRLNGAAVEGDYFGETLGRLVDKGGATNILFRDMASAVENAANPGAVDRLFQMAGMDFSGIGDAQAYFEGMGEALAAMPLDEAQAHFRAMWEEAGGTEEKGQQLLEIMPAFAEAIAAAGNEAGVTGDRFDELAWASGDISDEMYAASQATGDMADEQERLAGLTETTTDEIREQTAELQTLYDLMREMGDEFMSVQEAQNRFGQELLGITDAMEEFATLSGEALNEAGDNWDFLSEKGLFADEVTRGIAQAGLAVVDSMREAGASSADLTAEMDRTRQAFIDAAVGFGMSEEAAGLLADQMGLIPERVTPVIDLQDEGVAERVAALQDEVNSLPDGEIVLNGDSTPADEAINSIIETINTTDEQHISINGDLVPIEEALSTVESLVAEEHPFINIDANIDDASTRMTELRTDIEKGGIAKIGAVDFIARNVLSEFELEVTESVPQASIDANNEMALFQTERWREITDNAVGTAGVDAEDRGATAEGERIRSLIDTYGASVTVGAWANWPQINGIIAGIQAAAGAAGASVAIGAGAGYRRASGGEIWGPGSATSDSIPALLSNGEFVVRTAAADHYGRGLLHAINSMSLPKHVPAFASGGQVGRLEPARSWGGGQTIVQRVPVPTRMTIVDTDDVLMGSFRVAAHAEDRAYARIEGAWS